MDHTTRISKIIHYKFPEPFQIESVTVTEIVDGQIDGLTLDELSVDDLETIITNLPNISDYKGKKLLRSRYAWLKSLDRDDFDSREEFVTQRDAMREEIKALFAVQSINEIPEIIYSINQLQFIEDAENCGLDVDYGYSGRGMYGNTCPAVRLDHPNEITTTAKWQMDSMGLGVVVYAQN